MCDADPKFGIDCLGKVNSVYADDRELMIKFYDFVSRCALAFCPSHCNFAHL